MTRIKSILLVLIILGGSMSQVAFGQETRNCQPNEICVLPGDYLKYYVNSFGMNTTTTYSFENFVDPHTINVNITSDTGNGTISYDPLLNLKNNTLTYDNGKHQSFLMMMPLPLGPSWIGQPQFSDEIIDFNGVNRMTIGHHTHTATTSSDVNLDKQTGVMINFDAFSTAKVFDRTLTRGVSFKLLDTNMIPSIHSKSMNSSESTIPQWVRNTAKWWSQGSLSDSEFIQSIQYLINQGILKIPQTAQTVTQGSQIPQWIKSNAGWWASGEISDQEFIKGIEYLVSNGIIVA